MPALEIVQLPCLSDNYCVLLHDAASGMTAAIDAPDAATIADALDQRGWTLTHILTTHHHNDHTGGNIALQSRYGCSIIGPETEADRIPGITMTVGAATKITLADMPIEVLETPGHTLGHVSYYWPQIETAFTGDTLFALGCGRVFEGNMDMMWKSLQKIAALPDQTTIYCGHEYTQSNGRFALKVEPDNAALVARMAAIDVARSQGQPTLPTTIAEEKATNPFLRPNSGTIRAKLGLFGAPESKVFAALRELKNKG